MPVYISRKRRLRGTGGMRRLITKPETMVTLVLHDSHYYIKFYKTTNYSKKVFSYQAVFSEHP